MRINSNRKNNYIWILSRKNKSTIKNTILIGCILFQSLYMPLIITASCPLWCCCIMQLLLPVPSYLFEAITVHFHQVFWGWKSKWFFPMMKLHRQLQADFLIMYSSANSFFHFCYFQVSFLYCKCTFPSKSLNHLCAKVFDAWAWLYLLWFSTKLLFSLENRMRMQVLSSLKPEHCKIRLESWRRFYLELACVKMNFHGLLIQENQNVIGRKWYFDVCNPSLYFNIPLLRNRLNY